MNTLVTVPFDTIASRIFLIRGKKVMVDNDLAGLYGTSTRDLNKSVKRNARRFPPDFMFVLNKEEFGSLMFQFGTSKIGRGGRRKSPNVFTEQGVAMLSSILNSERAVQVNIQIIRTFTKLREILSENKKLAERLEAMEAKYDSKISKIFEVIRHLVTEKEKPREKMGVRIDN